MALVIDEYGGVDGLVTIEDLIETVIGEIDDEHDEEDAKLWVMEKPGVYLAQARAPLEELEAAIGLRLRTDEDDEEIDTLGGLVFLRTGRVPARGELVPHESGAVFEIVDADPRRIKRLRLRLPGAAPRPRRPACASSRPDGAHGLARPGRDRGGLWPRRGGGDGAGAAGVLVAGDSGTRRPCRADRRARRGGDLRHGWV